MRLNGTKMLSKTFSNMSLFQMSFFGAFSPTSHMRSQTYPPLMYQNCIRSKDINTDKSHTNMYSWFLGELFPLSDWRVRTVDMNKLHRCMNQIWLICLEYQIKKILGMMKQLWMAHLYLTHGHNPLGTSFALGTWEGNEYVSPPVCVAGDEEGWAAI